MKRKYFRDLVADVATDVTEIFPWDLAEELEAGADTMLLDVRCPSEFRGVHIDGSINVPRGILETACDFGYEETVPELVDARERRIAVICRSGNRSVLGAYTLQLMGYREAVSLRTGLRGWNDYEQPLVSTEGRRIPIDEADDYFQAKLTPEQEGKR